jgi:hypothetical protein
MKALTRTTSSGFFGFKRHHLVIVAVLLVTLLVGVYFILIQSEAYEEAQHFALTDPEVRNLTGSISEVNLRFWSGAHVTYSGSGGEASFVLSVKGEKEEAILDVRMTRTANSWNVIEAYLTTKNQKGIPIKQKTGTPSAYFNVVPHLNCGRVA